MTVVLKGIRQLHSCAEGSGSGDLGSYDDAALAWEQGAIVWAGERAELPAAFEEGTSGVETLDAAGALVLPGLIDCHTHLAFAGSRADEFERRLMGEGYLEIAAQGGGIASTVAATRAASSDVLLENVSRRAARMMELGVTTVECKSGYGLDLATEIRLLEVYAQFARQSRMGVVSTFLGAHVVAPEYRERRDEYLDLVCEEMLPEVAGRGLAAFCDVFVEEGAFSPAEARRILARAAELGLGAKLHVDQLSDLSGGELAAEVGATSADHLEHLSDRGIEAMASAGTVAVTLPFATLFLQQPAAPARRLIEAGVPVAVATDFNPGSAPSHHLPLALLMACVSQTMTAAEAVLGATRHAASAVGLAADLGTLEVGKSADLILLDAPSVEDWIYHFDRHRVVRSYRQGEILFDRNTGPGTNEASR